MMADQARKIFDSDLTRDAKVTLLDRTPGGGGYMRSILRTYPDAGMPEPGLSVVAKEQGKEVYLARREGTSQGFLVIPGDNAVKGPLPIEELEELDVWEPFEGDEDELLGTTLDG